MPRSAHRLCRDDGFASCDYQVMAKRAEGRTHGLDRVNQLKLLVGCAKGAMMAVFLVVTCACSAGRIESGAEPTSAATGERKATRSPSVAMSSKGLEFPDGFIATMERHGLILEPVKQVADSVSAGEAVHVAASTWALFGPEDPVKVQLFRATLPEMGPLSDPSDPGSPVVPTYVNVPMWVIYAPVELPRFEPSPELGTVSGIAVAVVTAKGEAVAAWTLQRGGDRTARRGALRRDLREPTGAHALWSASPCPEGPLTQ